VVATISMLEAPENPDVISSHLWHETKGRYLIHLSLQSRVH
jgi:hypothetical protein